MTKVTNIRTKMAPEWVKKGREVMDRLSDDDREAVVVFVFNLILEDVKNGLNGEKYEVFFDQLSDMFEASHAHCYFSETIDGNEVGFDKDKTTICPICGVKVKNILQALAHGKPGVVH